MIKFIGAFSFLFFGIIIGIFIEANVTSTVMDIADYIIALNYFKTHVHINYKESIINLVMLILFFTYALSFLFTLLVWIFISRLINSRNIKNSKLAEDGKIKLSTFIVYIYSWLLIGIILGANINHYVVLIDFFRNVLAIDHFNFPNSWSRDSLIKACKFINARIQNLGLYVIFQMIVAVFSYVFILVFMYENSEFSASIMKLTKNFYKCDFPYMKIKTESGEVKGQLSDIRNKSLVTLSEKNVFGVVPWDKIEIMEVYTPFKNEYFVFDNDSKNKK